jgi:hypothetical protein
VVRRISLIVVAVAMVAGAIFWWRTKGPLEQPSYGVPGEGPSLTVEVLNGAGVNGLAGKMARQLRRFGIDVVYYGTATADTFRVTQIVFRRGDTTAARRIRDALGTGVVRVELDSLKLLDATLFLGSDAHPSDRRP